MDSYQVALSWGLFGAAAAGCAYYYWPAAQDTRGTRRRDEPEQAARGRKREQEGKQRLNKQSSAADLATREVTGTATHGPNGSTRKRKVQTKEPAPFQGIPAVAVQADEPEDVDESTRAFAERMAQTQKGTDLSTKNSKEQRVKTVKQNSALNTPALGSSQGGTDADDDLSPAVSPALHASGVEDMLEPKPSGPTTLRVTAPTKPQKERSPKKAKEEQVETKKQRQNRQKVEAQRLQREAEERERKVLEERQRRAAREARGEPARNGIAVSKPPTSNAWVQQSPPSANGVPTTAPQATNGHAPLLDTFDAESTGSSNGGMANSTAATSTSSAGGQEFVSEERQLAEAMRQSEDESGWTTVAQPKKQKKRNSNTDAPPTDMPVVSSKTNIPAVKPAVNGKPKGFQALDVEYEQRTDADPNDASNWDA